MWRHSRLLLPAGTSAITAPDLTVFLNGVLSLFVGEARLLLCVLKSELGFLAELEVMYADFVRFHSCHPYIECLPIYYIRPYYTA